MEIEFKMPDLATTDSEIKVIRWLVEAGQPVKRGQVLLEVETDKATMEVESIATGRLKEIRARPGEALSAGQLLAVISDEAAAAPRAAGGMFARNRAAAAAPISKPARQPILLSPVQRTAARRMQESKQTIPHFYLQASANAEPMLKRRQADPARHVAWDAFFVHAAGRALKKFERMCFRYENDRLVPTEVDAIGVAVDHEGELFVATITDPAGKTPEQISDELRALVARLKAGDAEARRLRPANLTITNLGGTGVETFAAIVNPPEVAILAFGRAAPVAVVRDGAVVPQTRLALTLSADHRVVNGKYAAGFLDAVVHELESL
jgi:pyruvate dehydrogenase E2 component (dihydrolipoamide acetyltransferase)